MLYGRIGFQYRTDDKIVVTISAAGVCHSENFLSRQFCKRSVIVVCLAENFILVTKREIRVAHCMPRNLMPLIERYLSSLYLVVAYAIVSGGTAVMHDVEGYRRIPNKRIQGWGQGLALAFLSELYLNGEQYLVQ